MNTTKNFKNTIQAYLERRAFGDELFAQAYKKPDKNIDDCVTYILNQVKESGCNGFADAEIYNLATHYYMEDEIEIGKKVKCEVVVNHKVELTEEDRKEAEAKVIAEQKAKEAAEKKAKNAPDKTKLIELATQIESLNMPEIKGEEAQKILSDVKTLLSKVSVFIREKSSGL